MVLKWMCQLWYYTGEIVSIYTYDYMQYITVSYNMQNTVFFPENVCIYREEYTPYTILSKQIYVG